MILYPAIDLKGGQCVRLLRGDMDQATVFNTDPAAQARAFVAAGAQYLHIVDLDGAFDGKPLNQQAVMAILSVAKEQGIHTQLGGGIREIATIDAWLGLGIDRVILGTAAVKNPALVLLACREFPGRVAVGIDARGGKVAVEGWAEQSDVKSLDIAKKFEHVGVAAIIYTDIDRDGALEGVNVEATAGLARQISTPVIASGGVSSLDDIRALKQHPKIAGAILGRSLYEGRIDLREALDVAG